MRESELTGAFVAKPRDEAAAARYKPTDKTTDKGRDKALDRKASKYQSTAQHPRKHSEQPHGKTEHTAMTAARGKLVIHPDDTLSKPASSHHIKGGRRKLYEANKDLLSNPHLYPPRPGARPTPLLTNNRAGPAAGARTAAARPRGQLCNFV